MVVVALSPQSNSGRAHPELRGCLLALFLLFELPERLQSFWPASLNPGTVLRVPGWVFGSGDGSLSQYGSSILVTDFGSRNGSSVPGMAW